MSYCYSCGGQGYKSVMGVETCHTCCGTGRDMKTDLYMDYCKTCGGSKTVAYCRRETCNQCDGTGKILNFSGQQQYNIYRDYRNSRR